MLGVLRDRRCISKQAGKQQKDSLNKMRLMRGMDSVNILSQLLLYFYDVLFVWAAAAAAVGNSKVLLNLF